MYIRRFPKYVKLKYIVQMNLTIRRIVPETLKNKSEAKSKKKNAENNLTRFNNKSFYSPKYKWNRTIKEDKIVFMKWCGQNRYYNFKCVRDNNIKAEELL